MITGLPNFAVCIGYTNASWTLRADLTHRLVCRVLNYLDAARLRRRRAAAARGARRSARCSTSARATSSARSTRFPRQGDRGPWRVRQNYLLDSLTTMRRGLRGSMDFTPRSAVRAPAAQQQDDA